jgi:membrane protein
MYYSASLSFFTIFSLLPILALMIVLASTMPTFNNYISLLTMYVLDLLNPIHSKFIALNIKEFLSNTNKLGSIGIGYLIVVFTLFFNNYEDIINKIFNVHKRPIYQMFFLYISFLLLVPLLFSIFILTTSFVKSTLEFDIISYIFTWWLFIIIFHLSVNKKIILKASLFGSLLTLISLSITKKLFILYVFYNTAYATIYGSFSALLFFFLWIYISWTIYLYGMKFTSIINNIFQKQK